MARPKSTNRGQLREVVLNAAERLVEKGGLGLVTARAIANQAGFAPGTLYNLFADLDEIMLLVLSKTLKALGDELAAVPQLEDPSERLHAYAKAYVEFIGRNARQWQALLDYTRNRRTAPPDWYIEYIRRLTTIIAGCLLDVAPGTGEPVAARQAKLLWAGIYGLSALESEGRLDVILGQSLEASVHALVEIHLLGYAALAAQTRD